MLGIITITKNSLFKINEAAITTRAPAARSSNTSRYSIDPLSVCSMIQGTSGFTDFSNPISNYETDVFRPIFDVLEKACDKRYGCTLPKSREGLTDQELTDISFRVIADHVRTLDFAIADGIRPGNAGRNYVLRRVLRRAVKFARSLGLGVESPFLGQLVPTLVDEFGSVFPELQSKKENIIEILDAEELLFGQTIDRGIKLFESERENTQGKIFSGSTAFDLESTYGFPIDLTELMASEFGLSVDKEEYEKCLSLGNLDTLEANHFDHLGPGNIDKLMDV